MDDPHLDIRSHSEALQGLARLNMCSASSQIIWAPIEKLSKQLDRRIRVLDIATGSGDILREVRKKAHNQQLSIELVGSDVSATALKLAKSFSETCSDSIDYIELNALVDSIPDNFDVLTCSLFLHHLDPPQVVHLLRKMSEAAKNLIIINDLVRSEFSLVTVWIATRLLTRSPIVHFDGPASVRAAYTVEEMKKMATDAGLVGAHINYVFPCRMTLIWRRSAV